MSRRGDLDRFWSRVRRDPDGCWPWLLGKDRNGYGVFRASNPRRSVRAHRFAYSASTGEIPVGMLVCHACDNPACVRPSHLFLGTVLDNNRDRDAKGRDRFSRGNFWNPEHKARGRSVNTCKLDESGVRAVRKLREEGRTLQSIGDGFGVTKQSVRAICLRQNWGWLQ